MRRRGVFTGLLTNPALGEVGGVGGPNEDARCESCKPDFHGTSAASLVDPASVTAFMGGLASIATASLELLPLARQIRPKAGGEKCKRSPDLHLMWVRPESALNS